MSSLKPWHEVNGRLVDVTMGRTPADLVVRGGRWVNVHSGEIIENTDLAVSTGRFAYCGPDASHCIGKDTRVVEAEGRHLVPGLCDAHMHVESGMVTVTEFCRAVIPHGTTSMFIDPHEIANVLGLPGVRLMHDEAMAQPINVFVQMPSCVPSAPGLEHAGASITAADVAEAMTWPNIVGLGEMMNFPGIVAGDAQMLEEVAETMRAGRTVGGHYASPDLGKPFHAYAAGGPADDHEGTRMEDAIARVRQGMTAMLRLGSAWYDVEAQIRAVTEQGLDPRKFVLCTDDSHSGTLVHDGHMNRVVRHAIECGCPPITAIQMATVNVAEHFGMARDIGSIAPGRRADFLLTSDLEKLPVERVFARGVEVASGGDVTVDLPAFDYPIEVRGTVQLGRALEPDDFRLPAPDGVDKVEVNVIGVVENQAPTRALTRRLSVRDGTVEGSGDTCMIALVERHRGTGGVTNAFVEGFGYDRPCALATSVAHDSHHMIVVGTSREDMALAVNRLGEVGGGAAFFAGGEEKALIEMPIAGLMSDEPSPVVAEKADRLLAAMRECGCTLNNAYMQHTLLALVVIPALRISDVGLVDVTRFETTEIFVEPA